jgi:hypothetical protein
MPLVRIDLSSAASQKLRQTISDVVYDAMLTVAKVPPTTSSKLSGTTPSLQQRPLDLSNIPVQDQ